MKNSKPTQCQRVMDYLEQFGTITQYDAYADLGIMRLASRISELKKNGEPIEKNFISVKNRFGDKCDIACYNLKKEVN